MRATLDAWTEEGILRRDAAPALYALRQEFTAPDGQAGARDGFFALLRLEDYGARVVRPHERTLAGPKADRLKMLRAARANLSPVFFLYEDPAGELNADLAAALDAEAGDAGRDAAGTRHRIVSIDDAALHQRVADFFAERPVVIADGHHRYETALAYREECRASDDAPEGWLLGYFANAYAPGSLLLPIHRVLLREPGPDWAARIEAAGWKPQPLPAPTPEKLPAALDAARATPDEVSVVADDGSGSWVRFSRSRDATLSIRAIHAEILEGALGFDAEQIRDGAIAFPKSAQETARMVRDGEGHLALYLNALTPEDVFAVTGAGEVLPQKSTFFFPKLPSGLLFRPFEGGEGER